MAQIREFESTTESFFILDGVSYPKVYEAMIDSSYSNTKIKLVSTSRDTLPLVFSTEYTNIRVDGDSFGSASEAISRLNQVVFSKGGGSGDGGTTEAAENANNAAAAANTAAQNALSGIKGTATTTTVPATTGFERWLVYTAATYTNFKDAGNASIVVSAADLDVVNGVANNRVILEVNNGVATKRVERVKGDAGPSVPIVQNLGTSTTATISQKSVTDSFNILNFTTTEKGNNFVREILISGAINSAKIYCLDRVQRGGTSWIISIVQFDVGFTNRLEVAKYTGVIEDSQILFLAQIGASGITAKMVVNWSAFPSDTNNTNLLIQFTARAFDPTKSHFINHVNDLVEIEKKVNKSELNLKRPENSLSSIFDKAIPATYGVEKQIPKISEFTTAIEPQYDAVNGANNDSLRILTRLHLSTSLIVGDFVKIRYKVFTKNNTLTPNTNILRFETESNATSGTFSVSLFSTEPTNGGFLRTYESSWIQVAQISSVNPVRLLIYHYQYNYAGYTVGDYYLMGAEVYQHSTNNFTGQLIPTWKRFLEEDVSFLLANSEGSKEVTWNNVGYNRAYVSSFLRKKAIKELDEFNELVVTIGGTSSFGREYSLFPDNSNDYPTANVSGRYAPNEEYKNITYYLRQMLKFEVEDVIFSPAVSTLTDVTKSGSFSTFENNDFVKYLRSQTIGNTLVVNTGGHKFIKVIYNGTANVYIDNILVDSNLNLTGSKFPFKKYNVEGKSTLKIESVNTSTLDIWGFEKWTRPKVGTNNIAVGGTTSSSFLTWSKWIGDLITYQIPGGNDTSTTNSTYFKGVKIPSSPASTGLIPYSFIYASETGTYANYGNLALSKGDYAEYNGSTWILGSTKAKEDVMSWYANVKQVIEKLLPSGIPQIAIVQHKVGWIDSRPWQKEIIELSRRMFNEKGIALIDVFEKSENTSSHLTDGTHYAHNGALSYAEEYARIFSFDFSKIITPDYEMYERSTPITFYAEANAGYYPTALNGVSSSTTVNFDVAFSKIPKVRIFNNSSVVLSSVTKKGFTTSGSGTYEWEAKLSNEF